MKPHRFFAACLALFMLTACAAPAEPDASCQIEVLAMDTIMTLTVYGQNERRGEAILQDAAARIRELESLLSVTDENSELYRANHSGGMPVPLSDDTLGLLTEALSLCASTDGALDISVYPAVRAWGFTTGAYRVPETAELKKLLSQVDYTRIALENGVLTLPEGMELDLGAVAKGYAGDRLMELFKERGVTSAIASLGGNVQTLGAKPDGSPWRVAVQAPEGGYAGVLEVVGKAVITSGGYQRYFEQDGNTYIHIIDPATGYPVENELASVTIVADSGTRGDGLSTALFVMGREGAAEYWRGHRDFDFVILTKNGGVVITEGLEDCFSLYGEWENAALEVLR